MTRLADSGIRVEVPNGWKGRVATRVLPARTGRERAYAVVHVATIPLPEDTSDFGSNVVRKLGAHDVFFTLFEYAPESATEPLFAHERPSVLRARDFTNDQLQRQLDDQLGVQRFFTETDRAFCLYVVLGSIGARRSALATVNSLLASVRITDPAEPVAESVAVLARSRPELTRFTAAFDATGLTPLLEEPGPLTVFAPTDDAFVEPSDSDELAAALLAFVVRDEIRTSEFPTVTRTAAGTDVALTREGGRLAVGGHAVLVADLPAANGVLHIVAGVSPS